MEELQPCRICQEDLAYIENEGGWCAYVTCPICGTHTTFCQYKNDVEKEEAEKKAVMLWNMGKVIAEKRGE